MLRLLAETSTPIDDAEKDDLLHHMSGMYKVRRKLAALILGMVGSGDLASGFKLPNKTSRLYLGCLVRGRTPGGTAGREIDLLGRRMSDPCLGGTHHKRNDSSSRLFRCYSRGV